MVLSKPGKIVVIAIVVIVVVSALGGALVLYSRTSPPDGGAHLRQKGSDTMLELCLTWASAYTKQTKGVTIDVEGGGSNVGILALINSTTDIAQSSRPLTATDFSEAHAHGVNPVNFTVAIDGISVIVNSRNPVENLTLDQLRGIFNGTITNWMEVGGANGKIDLFGRNSTSGTWAFFKQKVLLDYEYSSNMTMLEGNTAILNNVQGDTNSIGYVGIGYAKNVSGITLLGISADHTHGAVSPMNETAVLDGTYYLSRYLYLITNGTPNQTIAEYLRWILSPDGQAIANEIGFYKLPSALIADELRKLPAV